MSGWGRRGRRGEGTKGTIGTKGTRGTKGDKKAFISARDRPRNEFSEKKQGITAGNRTEFGSGNFFIDLKLGVNICDMGDVVAAALGRKETRRDGFGRVF